jgi:enoyl-CoA hydratase
MLSLDREGALAIVTAERPAVLNALNPGLLEQLTRAVRELGDDSSVRAIALTGAGRAFMAGADVRFMAQSPPQEFRRFVEGIQELTRVIRGCPVPVVAAINGPAVGAGCELACACDIRIASAAATFSFPESRIGLVVTSGASWLLPRLVGPGWARRLLLEAATVDAELALRIGLVQEVVAPEAVVRRAVEVCARIAEAERLAVALSKRLLVASEEGGLEPALRLEVEAILSCFTEGQAREGLMAFLEKRDPSYRGEAVR